MKANEELHSLLDALPDADLPLVSRFLHFLAEGNEPPLSDADRAAVYAGDVEIERGEFVGLDQLKIDLGL